MILVLMAANPPSARVMPYARLKIHEAAQRLVKSVGPHQKGKMGMIAMFQTLVNYNNILIVDREHFNQQPLLSDRFHKSRVLEINNRYSASLQNIQSSGSNSSWACNPSNTGGAQTTYNLRRPGWVFPISPNLGDLVIVEHALDYYLSWLWDEQSLKHRRPGHPELARAVLQFQLQEVDWWLQKNGGSTASRNALDICRDICSNGNVVGLEDEASPMKMLLVYRAGLFGALCATGADLSLVSDTKLGRQMVRVL